MATLNRFLNVFPKKKTKKRVSPIEWGRMLKNAGPHIKTNNNNIGIAYFDIQAFIRNIMNKSIRKNCRIKFMMSLFGCLS